MSNILLLETATRVCSVALLCNGNINSLRETTVENSHSQIITTFIAETLAEAGLSFAELNAVAVSKGPGSYTGLRIGVSTAKGLCYALGIPLISVGTLHAMAALIITENTPIIKGSLLCPMIDARRMEVYTALYKFDSQNQVVNAEPVSAKIVDELSFGNELAKRKVYFFGDGAAKCIPVLGKIENAVFVDDFQVSAKGMAEIAQQKFNNAVFEDVAYFEPFYLKDFVATIPRNKFL